MSSDTTRNQLIQAARVAFIRNGYNNTSMIDIARESGKGRRTLYMYFDNKLLIYQAVINAELERIVSSLSEIANKDYPPHIKIIEVIFGRFSILKEAVYRNGTLRSGFFRDIWSVEHFRKDFDSKEYLILMQIITDGMTQGIFHLESANLTTHFLQCFMKGLEAPYIRGKLWFGYTPEQVKLEAKRLIYGIIGFDAHAVDMRA